MVFEVSARTQCGIFHCGVVSEVEVMARVNSSKQHKTALCTEEEKLRKKKINKHIFNKIAQLGHPKPVNTSSSKV